MKCKRGEIWWVDLEPTKGKEAKKIRASLIIQNDIGNEESDLTTVSSSKNYFQSVKRSLNFVAFIGK